MVSSAEYISIIKYKLNIAINYILFHWNRQKVLDFFDLTTLKDLVYINIALGISLVLFADGYFFTLQPMYLYTLGFTEVRARFGNYITYYKDSALKV